MYVFCRKQLFNSQYIGGNIKNLFNLDDFRMNFIVCYIMFVFAKFNQYMYVLSVYITVVSMYICSNITVVSMYICSNITVVICSNIQYS